MAGRGREVLVGEEKLWERICGLIQWEGKW